MDLWSGLLKVSCNSEIWSEKMRKRNRLSILLLAGLAVGISGQTQADGHGAKAAAPMATEAADPMAAKAAEAISVAKASLKKAASLQAEWRDSGKLVKKAEAAAKKGDYSAAIKLAAQAADEGDMAYQQGAAQQKLTIPSYLKSKY